MDYIGTFSALLNTGSQKKSIIMQALLKTRELEKAWYSQ